MGRFLATLQRCIQMRYLLAIGTPYRPLLYWVGGGCHPNFVKNHDFHIKCRLSVRTLGHPNCLNRTVAISTQVEIRICLPYHPSPAHVRKCKRAHAITTMAGAARGAASTDSVQVRLGSLRQLPRRWKLVVGVIYDGGFAYCKEFQAELIGVSCWARAA